MKHEYNNIIITDSLNRNTLYFNYVTSWVICTSYEKETKLKRVELQECDGNNDRQKTTRSE
jgi:hypothetical protein